MNLINAIASTLKVSPNQIKSVDEWASVYFVRFTVGRPTFVSKKGVKVESLEEVLARKEREQEENANKAEALAAEIEDALPIGNCVSYSKLFSAATEILEGEATFEEIVKRFTSKKIIKK